MLGSFITEKTSPIISDIHKAPQGFMKTSRCEWGIEQKVGKILDPSGTPHPPQLLLADC